MPLTQGRGAVSWEFFETMAKAFHEWRALHPYADPRLLSETLREQAERKAAEQADVNVTPPGGPPNSP